MDIRTLATRGFDLWVDQTIITVDLDSTYTIWDGTEVADTWPDWLSSGVGVEDPSAAYSGDNGLLVVNTVSGTSVMLNNIDHIEIDINNYNFLAFWINIRNWNSGQDITISLYSTINKSSDYLVLSDYINFDKLQQWQRVVMPLERFNIRQSEDLLGSPTYINEVEFVLNGGVDFWMDNLVLVVGEWNYLPIGPPVVDSTSLEDDIIPSMSPSIEEELVPRMSPFSTS